MSSANHEKFNTVKWLKYEHVKRGMPIPKGNKKELSDSLATVCPDYKENLSRFLADKSKRGSNGNLQSTCWTTKADDPTKLTEDTQEYANKADEAEQVERLELEAALASSAVEDVQRRENEVVSTRIKDNICIYIY